MCAADPSPAGARDAALLAALYGGGLRRSEAVALDVGDVDVQTGAVTVRAGKGRKDRVTYLPAGGIAAVRKEVLGRAREDPCIVGVVSVRIGDRVMEGSVRHKMLQLRKQMLGA